MTDYERGVEQASAIYKEVIREYVAENAKLRKLVARLMGHIKHPPCEGCSAECDCTDLTRCDEWSFMEYDARELGVDE